MGRRLRTDYTFLSYFPPYSFHIFLTLRYALWHYNFPSVLAIRLKIWQSSSSCYGKDIHLIRLGFKGISGETLGHRATSSIDSELFKFR